MAIRRWFKRQMGMTGSIHNVVAIQRAMQVASSEEITRLERNVPWLAITGAVTPFIGLFGTVWGIIDAFHGLGTAGAATLRAVAPGISEALITTAAGLAAAIPAVIAYNLSGSSVGGAGVISSYGNNRFVGNGSDGGPFPSISFQ